ncbi:hypothetical protein IW262DRAFT_1529393 [Armillaria fumosa]|nr:hypothetical protein IW262DRAFT_1529393 [Armillaria fumosa]
MGGRTGRLGLRVSVKRASVSKRTSTLLSTTEPDVVKNFVGASAPVNEEPDAEELEPTPEIKVQEPAPQFIPRFKGAAEMERWRRLRMAARRGPDAAPPPGPPPTLSFDDSSSDEDNPVLSSSDYVPDANNSMDDDFEPKTLTQPPHAESRPHRPQHNPVGEMSFTRKRIVPPKLPAISALSAMLKSTGTTTNPFSELYSLISGRGENVSSSEEDRIHPLRTVLLSNIKDVLPHDPVSELGCEHLGFRVSSFLSLLVE